jgi:hypothetical protein
MRSHAPAPELAFLLIDHHVAFASREKRENSGWDQYDEQRNELQKGLPHLLPRQGQNVLLSLESCCRYNRVVVHFENDASSRGKTTTCLFRPNVDGRRSLMKGKHATVALYGA